MGQMATAISRLEAQNSGKLPSQTVIYPRKNVSAITLKSGKELKEPEKKQNKGNEDNIEDNNKEEENVFDDNGTLKRKFPPLFEYKSVPSFPLALTKKKENMKENLIYMKRFDIAR